MVELSLHQLYLGFRDIVINHWDNDGTKRRKTEKFCRKNGKISSKNMYKAEKLSLEDLKTVKWKKI